MIYKFDKEKLVYVKDKRKARMLVVGVATALVLFFIIGRYTSFETLDKFEKELVILNLEKERKNEEE